MTILQTGPLSALELVTLGIVALCIAAPLLLARWRPWLVGLGIAALLLVLADAQVSERSARGCHSVVSSAGDTLERIVCDRP